MATKLTVLLKKPVNYNAKLIQGWNNARLLLNDPDNWTMKEISPVEAKKYNFDLYGIFSNVLGIPEEYIYPNLIINGYDSYNNYDTKRLRFRILNTSVLNLFYKHITRDSIEDTDEEEDEFEEE